MTYAETQEYLFALRSLGSKFGLERMRALYEAAGKPASAIPIVHVAGTNGKGSVCAMVEAMARANGYKTGLFTSPHLLRLGERVQVNRENLTEQQIIDYVEELRPLCERIAAGDPQRHPTFFELMTVIALLHFERQHCDVIALETGLGGRLDSTNVVQPAVCAITSIGLDHQEILGETLEQIAAEKAGIIKTGVPLVLGKLPEAARTVILAQAQTLGVTALEAEAIFDPATLDSGAAGSVTEGLRAYPQTSLAGEFQRRNAAVALLACEQLAKHNAQLVFDAATSLAALRSVQWAGRWQTLRLADGCELILDSSHNEEGARALEENLSRFVAERGVSPIVITGALGKERARSLLAVISRFAKQVFLVAVAQPRASSLEELRAAVPAGSTAQIQTATVEQLFAPAQRTGEVLAVCLRELKATATAPSPIPAASHSQVSGDSLPFSGATPVLVTGSIYLIGEILSRLQGDASSEAVTLQDKISN